MGALSPYYNYNCYPYQPHQTNNNSELITFQHHEQQQQQQSSLPQLSQISEHNNNHHFSSYLDETLFFQSPYFYSNETYPSHEQLLIDTTFSSQNDGFISMNEIFSNEQDFNFNTYLPKRQKLCYEEKKVQQQEELLNSTNFFVDEFITNPFVSFEAEPQFYGSASKFVDVVGCEKKVNEKTISPQSIAARERRRKITEKTQELGKLVPGGSKMNTAEMFNAAANYVKFLQAQVGMLQVMGTLSKEEKEPPPSKDLHNLLVSPFVQEKLYLEEKCFVPKEFVTTLTNHDDVRSKPTILKGLKQLIGTEINEKKPKQE